MRGLIVVFLVFASAASADESLTLWFKSVERSQEETICEVSRSSDGNMMLRVQKTMNSFPAPPEPILDTSEVSAAFDAVLARVADGSILMDEMNPDMPWSGVDGMELWLVIDGSESLLRTAATDVQPEILALFDPLGEGACTRLAKR